MGRDTRGQAGAKAQVGGNREVRPSLGLALGAGWEGTGQRHLGTRGGLAGWTREEGRAEDGAQRFGWVTRRAVGCEHLGTQEAGGPCRAGEGL